MQPHWQAVRIDGLWFEKGTSRQCPAFVRRISDQMVEVVDRTDGRQLACSSLKDIAISPRLGHTSRQLYFKDGQKFESLNNDSIDSVFRDVLKGSSSIIHKLESQWRMVLVALLLFIGFAYSLVQYGVPAAAEKMAFWLPAGITEQAANHTLRLLDETFLSPSELTAEQQTQLLQQFKPFIDHPDLSITIQFRHGGEFGANAFALPDGTIVFTDELVKLAEHPEELIAVLLHEIGHVAHRHGTQAIMQSSLLVVMAMAFIGDTSGIAELFMGMPLVMIQSAYSRDFEREADRFALKHMQSRQIAGEHLANLLDRIESSARCQAFFASQAEEEMQISLCETAAGLNEAEQNGWLNQRSPNAERWQSYLDSHPDNAERRSMMLNDHQD